MSVSVSTAVKLEIRITNVRDFALFRLFSVKWKLPWNFLLCVGRNWSYSSPVNKMNLWILQKMKNKGKFRFTYRTEWSQQFFYIHLFWENARWDILKLVSVWEWAFIRFCNKIVKIRYVLHFGLCRKEGLATNFFNITVTFNPYRLHLSRSWVKSYTVQLIFREKRIFTSTKCREKFSKFVWMHPS